MVQGRGQGAGESSYEYVIVISTDHTPLSTQPWVSMVWNDGSSSPAPPGAANGSNVDDSSKDPPALYNNEDFLMAQEADIDESLAKTDTSGQAYLRPFSRVHLASKLNIIAAPTVCIYHIEKQKMLDWNVRMGRLSRHRRDETWSRWKRGEVAKSVGFTEAINNSPITFAVGVIALAYYLLLLYGGQKYNVRTSATALYISEICADYYRFPRR